MSCWSSAELGMPVFLGSAQPSASFGPSLSLDLAPTPPRQSKLMFPVSSYLPSFSNFMGEEVRKRAEDLLSSNIPQTRGGGGRHSMKRLRPSGDQGDIL